MKKKPASGKKTVTGNGKQLRGRAEEILSKTKPSSGFDEKAELTTLLHELQVHQIELELQNQELMKAHLEAEEARAKYFDLYDLAPVGYLTLDRSATILEINFTGARMLGADRSKLVNRRFELFIEPKDINLFNAYLAKMFTTGEKSACELSLAGDGAPGARVRIEGALSAYSDPPVPHCRVVIIDVTKQRILETELRDALEIARNLHDIINRSPVVVIQRSAGKELPVEYISENVRHFGYSEQDFLQGRVSWRGIIHPDDAQRVDAEFARNIAAGTDVFMSQYRILLGSGETRSIQDIARIVRGVGGTGVRLEEIILDITARIEAEAVILRKMEELRVANDELSRFNRAMVDREIRMIELKSQVNELCERLGLPARYRTSPDEEKRP